jgi:16S rRNA (guanine966-N2)-methyltransferase
MDPPYNQEYEKRVLEILKGVSYVDEDTLIVVEASLDTDFDYAEALGFAVEKEKLYKTNKHVYIKKI